MASGVRTRLHITLIFLPSTWAFTRNSVSTTCVAWYAEIYCWICFRLVFPGRTFYLYTATADELREWINIIHWKLVSHKISLVFFGTYLGRFCSCSKGFDKVYGLISRYQNVYPNLFWIWNGHWNQRIWTPLWKMCIVARLLAFFRPFKINRAFWVTSLLPFPVSKWKTNTKHLMEKCYFLALIWLRELLLLTRYLRKHLIFKEKVCEISKIIHFFHKNARVFSLCIFFFLFFFFFCLAR